MYLQKGPSWKNFFQSNSPNIQDEFYTDKKIIKNLRKDICSPQPVNLSQTKIFPILSPKRVSSINFKTINIPVGISSNLQRKLKSLEKWAFQSSKKISEVLLSSKKPDVTSLRELTKNTSYLKGFKSQLWNRQSTTPVKTKI